MILRYMLLYAVSGSHMTVAPVHLCGHYIEHDTLVSAPTYLLYTQREIDSEREIIAFWDSRRCALTALVYTSMGVQYTEASNGVCDVVLLRPFF